MTGFGAASRTVSQGTVSVEARSVNNRFLKCQLKLSRNVAPFEADFEAIVREKIARGTLSAAIVVRETQARPGFLINETQALELYRSALDLARRLGSDERPALLDVLALPGVVCSADDTASLDEELLEQAKAALREALEGLVAMRRVEGASLTGELERLLDRIASMAKNITERSPACVHDYRDKLRKRLERLLADARDKVSITDEMLLRECAVFADKSDVAEETQRLGSHIEQFRRILATEEQVGRKLDFLIQEMLRESNTIASKAGDFQIAQWVVEMKVDLERLREQIQNAE
jgi:uncharacterized protein (TIGR00255 family)